jgi:hypothetical protein
MRPDNRRIDHLQRDITCATSGKRLQDHVEDAAIGPASKLPEDRIPVAKFLRQVTPRRARPHLPKNRIKHTAMVARRSATTSDKERFEIRPLIVRHQPANHSCSPQRTALNQFTILQSITLSTAPSLVFGSDQARDLLTLLSSQAPNPRNRLHDPCPKTDAAPIEALLSLETFFQFGRYR